MAGEDAVQGADFTGQYSRFSYDDSKDFVMLLKEESSISRPVPLLDDELNFMQYAQIAQRRKLASAFIGDGSPDNGFLVVGTGATNDFAIKAGKILVDGWLINLAADTTYNGQPIAQSSLTTPVGDRTDNAYIDIWADEIDAAEDASIVDPTITYQTSTRLKLKWAVKVVEDGSVPASGLDGDDKFHWYYKLATLSRLASNATITAPMVTDARAYNKPLQIVDPAIGRKNYLINGNFDIWQRGPSQSYTYLSTGGLYVADRWRSYAGGASGACTISRQSFALGQILVPGEPTYFLRHSQTTGESGASLPYTAQRVESVRTLAGKTATLSFYAKSSANFTVTVRLAQAFGSGGAPSATNEFSSTAIAATNAWAKHTITANVPSIAGKTLGSDGDDHLRIEFVFPANTVVDLDIAQIQLEESPVATQFEWRPIASELLLCMRYYEKSYALSVVPGTAAANGAVQTLRSATTATGQDTAFVTFKTSKRIVPTVVAYDMAGTPNKVSIYTTEDGVSANGIALTAGTSGTSGISIGKAASTQISYGVLYHWTADAEL